MDPKTISFEELTCHWSSGDNVYGSGFQLDNTTPNTIFDISFSNDSNKFFTDLIKSTNAQFTISPWIKKSSELKSEYIDIKQRKISMKATENNIAFCLDKNVTTNITQTAFFTLDSIIIYSVSEISKENNEKCNHMIIDRWTIKTHLKGVTVAINANILWNTYESQSVTVIKSKWLTFYQSHFETWRHLIKQYINCKYIGTWNKLNSYQTAKISMNNIEYSDGTKINITINTKSNRIIAYYSRKQFKGKLIEKNDENNKYQFIEWDNDSIWVKNGFKQFEGKYKNNNQMYIINNGKITMPITEKQIQFQLSKYNQIKYTSDDNIVHFGILSDKPSNIIWEDGAIWEREKEQITVRPVENSIRDIETEHEEKLEIVMENKKKTVEIEGEIDDIESIEEIYNFEKDLHIYCKADMSLEIKNNDHFVLVNESEMYDNQIEKDEKVNNDDVDEWFLV